MKWPEGRWQVSLIGVGGELVPPIEGSRLTLEVHGDHIGGSSGINRFAGTINDDGSLGPLATTRMAGSPVLKEQEQRYLAHLSNIDAVSEMDLHASEIVVLSLAPIE